MPTIQFTFNKKERVYCIGFWLNNTFIERFTTKDRQQALEQFIKELEQLEESRC